MKKKFKLLPLLLILSTIQGFTQWESTGPGPFNTSELIMVDDSLHTFGLLNDYSSGDHGTTWLKDSLTGMGAYPYVVSIAKTNDKYFSGDPYGHIYESTDGLNWTLNYNFGYTVSLPYMITDGESIYVAADGVGILHSENNGTSWVMGNTGLAGDGDNISQIIKIESDLYISTLGGVFKSVDGGDSWVPKNNGLAASMQCNGIGFSQGSLLTSGYGFGVYRSTDFGETWTQITDGFAGFLFVGGFYTNDNIVIVGGSTCKAHFSTDGGLTWTLIAQGTGFGFDVFNDFQIADGYLFAATTDYPLRVSLETLGITSLNDDEISTAKIDIFPIPCNEMLNIESTTLESSSIKELSIMDLAGKIILQDKNISNVIDVSDLSNGIYIMILNLNGSFYYKKINVQH